MKKTLKIAGIIIGIVLLAVIIFLVDTRIKINRGEMVKWEGKWYTKEQLKKTFPPQYIEVPAKNTPEEVYAKFREALLKNDLEEALELMTLEKREVYREAFKDKDKFDKWAKTLPETVVKESEMGNFAYYDVDYGTNKKNTMDFVKNSEGFWQIDSI